MLSDPISSRQEEPIVVSFCCLAGLEGKIRSVVIARVYRAELEMYNGNRRRCRLEMHRARRCGCNWCDQEKEETMVYCFV